MESAVRDISDREIPFIDSEEAPPDPSSGQAQLTPPSQPHEKL